MVYGDLLGSLVNCLSIIGGYKKRGKKSDLFRIGFKVYTQKKQELSELFYKPP